MIAGDALTPAERRAIVAVIQRATGAHRSACGNAVAALIVDGRSTRALVDLHQRAAALADAGNLDRCPRCLESRPLVFGDRCRVCEIDRLAAKKAARPSSMAAAVLVLGPVAPEPAAVLNRYDLEDVKAMCATKRAYRDEPTARRVADRCEVRRHVHLRTYQCPLCSGWHITKSREYRAPEAA